MNTTISPALTKKKPSGQDGMVLLVTLSAIAFLVPLVYAGVESQRFHLRQVQQELNLETAHRHATSLLALVVRILTMDAIQHPQTDHLNEPWANPIPLPGQEDGATEAMVEDTARRFNLNTLIKPDGSINHELYLLLTRLFEQEEISIRLLDNLVEWLNPIDMASGLKKTQTTSTPGFVGEPLYAMEQLLQIPDWDHESLNKIARYVTVDATCRTSLLNINTADTKTLALLGPNQNWQQLIESRVEIPIAQVGEVANHGIVLPPGISTLLSVNATCFIARIRSRVDSVAGTLTVWMIRNATKVTITQMRWNG